MTTDLIEQVKDGVAVLTLNRPDRLNAMSRPMLDALLEALPRLADDPEIGVVVLTGAGRGFCAGGDVKAMAEGTELGGQTMEEKAQALRSRMETSRWLHEMAKPTIAMMRGPAAGAGLSLAMACDMRIASDTVRLGTAFARVGYSGDFGGSYYLTQLVGTAKARELYFTADLLDAQQALGLGLVNRVVADARGRDDGAGLAPGPRAPGGLSLHEAEHERGGERVAQGNARSRGVAPHAHRYDRGPPGGRARLRGEAGAPVQGALDLALAPRSRVGSALGWISLVPGGGGPCWPF
jgi:2-(1,2-epoxy-1,2-dihydrophenyl)acetyl-CoA isomerase